MPTTACRLSISGSVPSRLALPWRRRTPPRSPSPPATGSMPLSAVTWSSWRRRWSATRPTTRPKSCRCCGTRTPRGPVAQPVFGIVRPGRRRIARRSRLHHPLEVRRRHAGGLSDGQGRPPRAVRRRRHRGDQRRHGRRDRCLPAPGPPRTRHRRGQQDRPPDGRATATRRRPAAVRRDADPRVHRGQPRPGAELGAEQSRRAAFGLVSGQARHDERPHASPGDSPRKRAPPRTSG